MSDVSFGFIFDEADMPELLAMWQPVLLYIKEMEGLTVNYPDGTITPDDMPILQNPDVLATARSKAQDIAAELLGADPLAELPGAKTYLADAVNRHFDQRLEHPTVDPAVLLAGMDVGWQATLTQNHFFLAVHGEVSAYALNIYASPISKTASQLWLVADILIEMIALLIGVLCAGAKPPTKGAAKGFQKVAEKAMKNPEVAGAFTKALDGLAKGDVTAILGFMGVFMNAGLLSEGLREMASGMDPWERIELMAAAAAGLGLAIGTGGQSMWLVVGQAIISAVALASKARKLAKLL